MTAILINDAALERSEANNLHFKHVLVNGEHDEKSHDEEDSGVSNESTTASSVCNSVNGHEQNEALVCIPQNEKPRIGELSNGAGTVNGTLPSKDGPIARDESRENESKFISFSLPNLHSLELATQSDFMLLAWALLVFRNNESGNAASFAWNTSAPVDESSRQSMISGESGSSPVSKALQAVREIRDDSTANSQVLPSDGMRTFFATANDFTEQNSKVSPPL